MITQGRRHVGRELKNQKDSVCALSWEFDSGEGWNKQKSFGLINEKNVCVCVCEPLKTHYVLPFPWETSSRQNSIGQKSSSLHIFFQIRNLFAAMNTEKAMNDHLTSKLVCQLQQYALYACVWWIKDAPNMMHNIRKHSFPSQICRRLITKG